MVVVGAPACLRLDPPFGRVWTQGDQFPGIDLPAFSSGSRQAFDGTTRPAFSTWGRRLVVAKLNSPAMAACSGEMECHAAPSANRGAPNDPYAVLDLT